MSRIPLNVIFKGVVPFLIADLVHLALLVAFPIISLFLINVG
jgi:TRAP-type C4-dicarboxylate transport system permease large subunit